jgi:hypothetical protein
MRFFCIGVPDAAEKGGTARLIDLMLDACMTG